MKRALLSDVTELVATGAAEALSLATAAELRRADGRDAALQAAERRHRLRGRATVLARIHEIDVQILGLEISDVASEVGPILKALRVERHRLVADSRVGRGGKP
ncbi:hypothetical protein LBMAG42_55810 [Deltaproteobacteria bacterium]|nr:hypothetical protein LBMAG42_55810 [Deltaproteobacteria bacterium]